MDELAPSPQTTLVILLGASEWPDSPDFQGSAAFANVARDWRGYLLNPQQFGLPEENFLDLFDTEQGPEKIDRAIRHFLARRTSAMRQADKAPRDLLFYFVGHGGFAGRNSEYYLAVRCTSSENPGVSGIRIESLATTLTDMARYLRRFIILDCCYAAAAFNWFQAEGPAYEAVRQTVDVFKEKAKTVGKGTSLLCSSGKKVASLLTPDGSYTMFSKALLHVLSTGNPKRQDRYHLSFREVTDLTEEVLDNLLAEKAPRPELHSPDQVDGDVADVPFFPNPVAKAVPLSTLSDDQTVPVVAPPSPIPLPGPPIIFSGRLSRRAFLVGGIGLAGVVAVGGGFTVVPLISKPARGSPFHTFPQDDIVYAVAWSPDGNRFASADNTAAVQIWDAASGTYVLTYRGHTPGASAVAWSPDGQYIASGGSDATVQVWEASTGRRITTYTGHTGVTKMVNAVVWSPNGKYLASAGEEGSVQVREALTWRLIHTYRGHIDQYGSYSVNAVAWSPESSRIASASLDETVQVWDASTGRLIYKYMGHSAAVNAVMWSPDGTRLASGSDDKTIQVWSPSASGTLHYSGHTDSVQAVTWSSDGQHLASGSVDKTVRVWDLSPNGNAYVYPGHTGEVYTVAWSPGGFPWPWSHEGQRLASGGKDTTVRLWQAV